MTSPCQSCCDKGPAEDQDQERLKNRTRCSSPQTKIIRPRMMMPVSVLLVFLQLSSFQLVVVSMPPCTLKANVAEEAHRQLRDLGAPFPSHCLQYNVNISFPDTAFPAGPASPSKCRRALWVVFESLRGTKLIIEDNESPVGEGGAMWDEEKFSTFQILQHRLLSDGGCLSMVAADPDVFSSYFSNVTDVLQQQDRAACGWMALRRDVLRVLKIALRKHHSCFT
ncbi:unnamed protein product [Pleuronectes platessa]|uniref:Uncharacterized protein n=1 Tax=Pleuronectes platessa TaxID=8262 RepID=A0A9N7U7T4_PLEPL|nr:unnamed protein product [Pleuronectes platessa]